MHKIWLEKHKNVFDLVDEKVDIDPYLRGNKPEKTTVVHGVSYRLSPKVIKMCESDDDDELVGDVDDSESVISVESEAACLYWDK